MIAVVFILEVIAGVLAFILMEHIEETLTTYLNASMIHYQDNQELRAAIDYIQRTVSDFCSAYGNNISDKSKKTNI